MIDETYSYVKNVAIGLRDILGCLGDSLKKRILGKGFIWGILKIICLMLFFIGLPKIIPFILSDNALDNIIITGLWCVSSLALNVDISEYKPLVKFSYLGNLTMVKLLLKLGFDPNKYSYLDTPLMAAIKSKNMNIEKKIRMLDLLLNNGADIEQLAETDNNCSGTVLMESCRKGYLDIVKFLVEKGADVNYTFMKYNSLGLACSAGHLDIVEFLVEKGADVNYTFMGSNSLGLACSAGHLDIVKFLVNNGADTSSSDYLIKACQNKHYDVAKYLVDIGIDFKFDDIQTLFGNMQHVESEMLCAIHDGNESRLSNLIKSYDVEKDSSLFLRMLEKHVLPGIAERCIDLKNMIQKRERKCFKNIRYIAPDDELSLLKNRSNKWNSTKVQIDNFIKTTKDTLTSG